MNLQEIIEEHKTQAKLDESRGMTRTAAFLVETVEHLERLEMLDKNCVLICGTCETTTDKLDDQNDCDGCAQDRYCNDEN